MLDALGREVARPQEGTLPAGTHEVTWDGRAANGQAAPAGVYLYRIETPHGSASGKIVLIRRR
jgi:flagellar hook assembly protein FlgD